VIYAPVNGIKVGNWWLALRSKPDPRTDVNCSLITFNEATINMLAQPLGYFEPAYNDRWASYPTQLKSYKECWYYGKQPMLLYIYSRKISNRSPFQPMNENPSWSTFTFPRKRFTTTEEMLATLKSIKPPSNVRVDFSYDVKAKRFKVNVPFPTCLRMEPIICDILGFKQRQYFVAREFTAEYPPALDRAVDNLFVYSDITDAVFVGNVKAPLLCIVPREIKRSGGSNSWSVDNPTYMPVSRQSFNQQRIVIMDDAGVRVPFDNGKSVLLLHFRKRL
jgi:hypothetical protein